MTVKSSRPPPPMVPTTAGPELVTDPHPELSRESLGDPGDTCWPRCPDRDDLEAPRGEELRQNRRRARTNA